ncbi:MAG TPA: tetratricopeptide repeat protein, partial [Patescibacteria group bacterium]|nr:tetratricopeptide repeat protein [Patescibacteria group bacterium]
YVPAQYTLGNIYYERSDLIKLDPSEVYFWGLLAYRNAGDDIGKAFSWDVWPKAMADHSLTPSQKAELDKKLEEWKPKKEKQSSDIIEQSNTLSDAQIPPKTEDDLVLVKKLAESGDRRAQYALGLFYQQPLITRDYIAAFKWYRRSAEQGEISAQEALGEMYYNPHGLAFDPAEAYFWLTLVYQQGRGGIASEWHSISFLKDEPKELTAEQKAAIDKKIQAWHPTIEDPSAKHD